MAILRFERVEEKYVITKKQYNDLIRLINSRIEKDKYYFSTICNIYFDTSNSDLIIKSMDKPIYKEKIRLRSYGVPNYMSTVFLEIKKKYKGIVNKRRISVGLNEVYNYLNHDIKPSSDKQIVRELDYCFKNYKLIPRMFVGYDRYSYKGINDDNLRITFDTNIRYRLDDLCLEHGDYGKNVLIDKYIMEIKTNNSMPLWFVKALSKLKIYPSSYSKYGNCYQKVGGNCV